MTLVVAALLSFVIGATLGLLGGGVSTLTLPMLVYVLGIAPETAIATSLFVLCVTSAAGAAAHARAGRVAFRVGAVFAFGGVLGAGCGGLLARALPPRALLSAFAIEMVAAALAMTRSRRGEPPCGGGRSPSLLSSVTAGTAIGTLSGLAGAGGGFLIVPALETVGGLGLREAIGTSPFVIALQSLAGLAGRAGHFDFDARLLCVLTVSTMMGCIGGARATTRFSVGALRRCFAVLVLGVALFVLTKQALPTRG